MKILTILSVHDRVDTSLDTFDSILSNLSEDVIFLIDGCNWDCWEGVDVAAHKLKGFRHGCPKSPYRNMALALDFACGFGDFDWICYTEYDVLFTSPRIVSQLMKASEMGVWMIGNDGHVDDKEMPLIESLIGEKLTSHYYLLGCCQFFHRDFMRKLNEIDFFDRFLNMTNEFSEGYMPAYSGYDVSEHMYPSLCRQFGGNIGVLASYSFGEWHGAYKHYPLRWRPELDPETEDFDEASVMHPLKDYDHPIRRKHREKRHGHQDLGLKSSRSGI